MNRLPAKLAAILGWLLVSAAIDIHDHDMDHEYKAQLIELLTGEKSGYNKASVPRMKANFGCRGGNATTVNHKCHPYVVNARLYFIRVQDLIENMETLESTVRLQLSWDDPALAWDPHLFGGLTEIIMPSDAIWAPRVQLANSIDDSISFFSEGDFMYRVTSTGRVWYHPHGKWSTRCKLNLNYYPFDYQKCALVVESLIYTDKEMLLRIRPGKKPISLGMYSENPMWSVINTTGFAAIYRSGRRTGFSRIHFWISLKRKPDFYQRSFIAPLGLLAILQVLTYLMPIKFIDRVPQATGVLLTAFFLQSYLSEQLPRSSGESLVQTYLNLIIAMSVLSCAVCIITIELVDPDDGLPRWGLLPLCILLKKQFAYRTTPSKMVRASPRRPNNTDSPTKTMPAITEGPSVLALPNVCDDGFEFMDNTSDTKSASLLRRSTSRSSQRQRRPPEMPELLAQIERSRLTKKLPTAAIVAAVINWVCFLLSLGVSIGYPLHAFVGLSGVSPPKLPGPTPDNITRSYYAEY